MCELVCVCVREREGVCARVSVRIAVRYACVDGVPLRGVAYLVHAGLAANATAALKMFGDIRTNDGKGVTIPSQVCAALPAAPSRLPQRRRRRRR